MNKTYANPPVIEAVCEFRFDPASEWDPTIPGLLYDELKNDFPVKKSAKIQEFTLTTDVKANRQQTDFHVRERVRFLKEANLFVQVDENLLAVNHLKPYSSWGEFSPKIMKAFEAYKDVANPKGIQRIGVRYVNQIEIPEFDTGKLEEYFNFRVELEESLKKEEFGGVMAGVVFRFQDARDQAKIVLSEDKRGDAEKKSNAVFRLDIDYFLAKPGTVSLGEVHAWVDNAHGKVGEIFEGAITDKTRALFE
ncbi:MAG TPA: TIGR04255 family protein [Candidatus Paceibacterota bacterium]